MRVVFLHGLGIKPGGIKPNHLREQGLDVLEPALPHGDFEESLRAAQRAVDAHHPGVVVGDCRGGAVALAVQSRAVPLVLIAPAWRKWGRVQVAKRHTAILHSPRDRVIPFEHSRELLRRSRLPACALVEVGRDHFMEDRQALEALHEAVRRLRGPATARGREAAAPRPRTAHAAPAEQVRAAASDALMSSAFPALRSVGCQYLRPTLVLYGTVPSYHLKQLAQEIVQRVPGVQHVENRLAVHSDARRCGPARPIQTSG